MYGKEKFLITKSHKVFLKKKSNVLNEFSLVDQNKVLVKFLYSIPDSKLNVSPFKYIDEDNFKWADFLSNIINDEERKKLC